MGLRIATIDDIDLVYKLSLEFKETTDRAKYFDDEKLKTICLSFLTASAEQKVVILYDDVGMIVGIKEEFPFGHDPMAVEVAWWVAPDKRKSKVGKELLDAFEFWAQKVGCKLICVSCPPNTIGDYYSKRDYKAFNHEYYKEI